MNKQKQAAAAAATAEEPRRPLTWREGLAAAWIVACALGFVYTILFAYDKAPF